MVFEPELNVKLRTVGRTGPGTPLVNAHVVEDSGGVRSTAAAVVVAEEAHVHGVSGMEEGTVLLVDHDPVQAVR